MLSWQWSIAASHPVAVRCAGREESRRQCPGYKDEFDIVFRNETQATEKRARKTLNTKRQGILDDNEPDFATSLGDNSNMQETSSSRLAMMLSTSEALSVPIEQQAPCFFVTNFILPSSDTRGTGTGHFDYLAPLMKTAGLDSPLSIAFQAVAMAALANRPNSRGRGLLPKAMGQYAKALKATNLALQNPAQQKSDQTLAAILMLGFFETVLTQSNSAQAWYSHADGAIQVVRMRDYRTAPEYSTESRLCQDLITDTIASIPFFLGWRVGQGGDLTAGEPSNGDARSKNFLSPSSVDAYFAMWPLFSISATDSITDLQRAWVKGRLVFIGEVIGLSHAKVLSGLRLPSMIIRRDNMGHAAPTPEMLAAAVTRGVYAPNSHSHGASNPPTNEETTPQSPFNPASFPSAGPGTSQNNDGAANPAQGQGQPLYTLNPLQQRQAMQKEAYEKERASLLKKASNSQGDAVEMLAAKFLAV
ncbi:hypothetical protein LAWI1_G000108 [Lachnellula willkommii]|uniref:Uncharacterized protein n=1 Tax=Lachnellula willkommii TaxID=215461 RepID=A0A559MNG9_9HELO|nr:hypothetical protein LAWI1_G000108 [Lachnellula willkommii]